MVEENHIINYFMLLKTIGCYQLRDISEEKARNSHYCLIYLKFLDFEI